jgi:hypothetical protein
MRVLLGSFFLCWFLFLRILSLRESFIRDTVKCSIIYLAKLVRQYHWCGFPP